MPHPDNLDLRISDDGLALIEAFEGFRGSWYLDAVSVRTIAYGWTGRLPDGYVPPLTEHEGRQLLRETVGIYEAAVRTLVAVPLRQNQFDALVSFTYNLGPGNLESSTLLRKLNAAEPGVGPEFDRWTKAGGRELAGLVRRRAAERALFERADAPPEADPADADPTEAGCPDPARLDDDAGQDDAAERAVGQPVTPLDARPPHWLEPDGDGPGDAETDPGDGHEKGPDSG